MWMGGGGGVVVVVVIVIIVGDEVNEVKMKGKIVRSYKTIENGWKSCYCCHPLEKKKLKAGKYLELLLLLSSAQ